ncbi:MAG TPA: hypothetical protein VK851_14405 [Anaerolineales bacterium]|nr:hypothetical protein [Anaerolineales bacterium]
MIETVQLPILLKAIDFIFDEGRKILQERRERRKMNENTPQNEPASSDEEIVILEPQKAQEIKQDLQTSKIDESKWQNHEAEVQHLVRLLETYTRNYHLSREQHAKWGDALVPAIIVHNLEAAENAVMDTVNRLETVLSKVYDKDIQPKQ